MGHPAANWAEGTGASHGGNEPGSPHEPERCHHALYSVFAARAPSADHLARRGAKRILSPASACVRVHACAAAAFGQRGRTLSTSHREGGAAAARGLCKACKLLAGPRMWGHTRRQAMLRAVNRPGSARRRAQPRPTRQRPITCFPDFTFQKTIPRRCRLVASVLEYSANLRDPSPSRSINRSTRLEARED